MSNVSAPKPRGAAEPAQASASPNPSLGLVLLLGSLTAFMPVSIDLYLPALPAIGRDLHASAAETELTLAVFFIGVAVGQLVIGPISDRVGRRGPLLFGLAVFTLASIGCAYARTIEALIGLRLVQALGGCAGVVLARAVVRDRFAPQATAHVFSTLMLVMGVAPILAPIVGSWILSLGDWPTLFWALAGFGLVCALAVLLTLKESLHPDVAALAKAESPLAGYMALLRMPRLVGYVSFAGLSSASLLAYISASADLLIGTYHLTPQAYGWLFGLNATGLIGASQLNRRLLRRFSYDQILVGANLMCVCAAVVLAATALTGLGGLVGVAIPLFFVIAGLGFNQANAMAGALSIDHTRAGATAALMGAFQFGAGAAASAIVGALHDGTARPLSLVIVACLLIAGASLHLLARPHRNRG